MVCSRHFRRPSYTVRGGELYLCAEHIAHGVFCLLSLNDWLRGQALAGGPLVSLGAPCEGRSCGICGVCRLLFTYRSPGIGKSGGRSPRCSAYRCCSDCACFSRLQLRKARVRAFRPESGTWEYLARQGAAITGYLLGLAIPLYSIDPPSPPASLWFLWIAVFAAGILRLASFFGRAGGILDSGRNWRFFCRAHPFFRRRTWWRSAACISRYLRLPSRLRCIFLSRHGYWRCSRWSQSIVVTSGRTRSVSGVKLFIATHTAPGRIFNWRELSNRTKRSRLLERAKDNESGFASGCFRVGQAYLTSGEPGKALGEFGRALAMAPDNPQALSNRGVALLMLKQTAAAKSDFERALEIDPCAFEARLNALRMGLHPAPAPQCRYSEEERKALSGPVNLGCRPNR